MRRLPVVVEIPLLSVVLLLHLSCSVAAAAAAAAAATTTTTTTSTTTTTTTTTTEETSYPCDESKCRATREHPWVDDDTEYTCWITKEDAQASGYPCSDGYVGRIVEDVPQSEQWIRGELRSASWYTCCPPAFSGAVHQTCSDTACSSPDWEGGGNCWADGFQEPMSCGDSTFRFPRFTGRQSLIYVQFLCCDAPPVDGDPFMDELLVARSIWMGLSSVTFLVCTIFITSILLSPRARSQGYNLYLVFLAIPDAMANAMIIVRNGLTITGVPVPPSVFVFLASFEYFYATSNMWLNAVIVGQIHYVLRKSNQYTKVPPPTVRQVCLQAGITYALSTLVFGWAMFLYFCGLVVFNLTTVVRVWISTRVIMVAPPLLYVCWVWYDVLRRQLLPRTGRTRVLSLYFLRIIIVFMVTWVPYFIIYEIAWNVTHSRWMVYGSYYLGSIQGFVSVVVALSKPDVKRAVIQLLQCQCGNDTLMEGSSRISLWGRNSDQGSRSVFGSRLLSSLRSISSSVHNHHHAARTSTATSDAESGYYCGDHDNNTHERRRPPIMDITVEPEPVVADAAAGPPRGLSRGMSRGLVRVKSSRRSIWDDENWDEEDEWGGGGNPNDENNADLEKMSPAMITSGGVDTDMTDSCSPRQKDFTRRSRRLSSLFASNNLPPTKQPSVVDELDNEDEEEEEEEKIEESGQSSRSDQDD